MDVIADTSAIRRWIVRAIDLCCVAFSQGDTQNQRDKMGLGLMSFPATRQCSASIKIPERSKVQTMNLPIPIQRLLDHQFGMSIYIRRTKRRFLGKWLRTGFVHRSSRRKDKALHLRPDRCLNQSERVNKIVVIEAPGVFHTF